MSGSILQSGPITFGHVPMWLANGTLMDGGRADAGALTQVGITNDGGQAFGINSGPIAGPYVGFGITVSSNGNVQISAGGFNGGANANLEYIINGFTFSLINTLSTVVPIESIATLRSLAQLVPAPTYNVKGYYASADGGGGTFNWIPSDTTSPDNGGTIIVDAAGNRYYRQTEIINVGMFGAKGDGVTDDTAAVQAAINSMLTGGAVYAPKKYFLGSTIVLAGGVTLKGPFSDIGAPGASDKSAPYGSMSSLRLAATATIQMSGGSAIDGCLIYPAGMTFPQTSPAAWTGTAITSTGNDVTVKNSMVMGFGTMFYSTGFERNRILYCNIDNVNGISIDNSQDTAQIIGVHAWPFATFQAGVGLVGLSRSGTAFNITNSNDWTKIADCFCYGYQDGYVISNSDSVRLIGCGADNTATGTQIGFSVVGTSQDVTLIGCQAAAQATGFFMTASLAHAQNNLISCDAWENTIHGVLIDATAVADVTIWGGTFRNSPNGITVNSATPFVNVDGVRFEAITLPSTSFNVEVSTSNVRIGPMCTFGSLQAGFSVTTTNQQIALIASAANVLLPPTNNVFFVGGSTSFGQVAGGWAGRVVTMIFQGSLTVWAGGASPNGIVLKGGAGSFTATNNSSLVLAHTGSIWVQL